jgi:hypothetical protein
MPSLRKPKSGRYLARGRIPADVRDEYGRRFGKNFEAKFSAPAGTKPADAKRLRQSFCCGVFPSCSCSAA